MIIQFTFPKHLRLSDFHITYLSCLFRRAVAMLVLLTPRRQAGKYYSEKAMREDLKLSETRIKAIKRRCLADQTWKTDMYEVLRVLVAISAVL